MFQKNQITLEMIYLSKIFRNLTTDYEINQKNVAIQNIITTNRVIGSLIVPNILDVI